jgi:4-amino-4-deoxy-L-arabinose transferase-like glycosyltransferase
VGFFVVLCSNSRLGNRKTVFWVMLVTCLGAALRLAAIGSVPVGLYQDEAYNGLDALRVLSGTHPLYFAANNGREPLFIYLASASIAGLGRTVAAVRLPAALLGTLTIPAIAALGSVLFNRRVGLLAATLVAITFWPLHLSRIAFRAVGLPLFIALALAAGWHGARRGNRGWILAGGVLYGLGFYTYLPIYFTPLILALFAIYAAGSDGAGVHCGIGRQPGRVVGHTFPADRPGLGDVLPARRHDSPPQPAWPAGL